MTAINTINLKVVVYDSDYYALQALNSYLAWDRRTRVTLHTHRLEQLWHYLDGCNAAELPDVVVLDVAHLGGAEALKQTIQRLQHQIPDVMICCLSQDAPLELVEMAAEMGAKGYMLKQEVHIHIAWAICYMLEHDFIVTAGVARVTKKTRSTRLYNAKLLPDPMQFPEMTDRIRQAIQLCVVEGMPAHLAADEMGISLHTIRGYIKEGYRILETADPNEHSSYPLDMTPQERAFMRFTALNKFD